jgi:drug/metabolite transporter (DMT)-like permease
MLVLFSCPVLKEKMSLWKGAALLCSFLGIVILSAGGLGGTLDVGGAAACIVAAACYGLFSVLNKKADYDQNIAMMVMWLVAAVCAAALGLVTEEWKPVVGVQWLGMLWLGVIIDAVAYLLWALSLKGVENTAKIANLAYLTPFLSLVVSAVVFKESIKPHKMVALVLIVGGILLQCFWDAMLSRKTKR